MYLARFSYDVLPINRQRAVDLIRREVEAARQAGLSARLLVPLTRGHGGAALQFEVELSSLDQLDQFRQRGVGSGEETADWMQSFNEILVAPRRSRSCASMTCRDPEAADQVPWRTRSRNADLRRLSQNERPLRPL
jgi:hypothetical protein